MTFGTSEKRKFHKSTVADLEMPKQSLIEYLFPRFDKFGNNIALVSCQGFDTRKSQNINNTFLIL
jgi:hypothetical protein